jgi:hydroxypyruvate isomerase
MPDKPLTTRRNMIAGALGAATGSLFTPILSPAAEDPAWIITNNRIKQSVVHWCFNSVEVEKLCQGAAAMGLKSVELIDPKYWPVLRKYGLVCAISSSHGFVKGWNHVENHDYCASVITKSIDATSEAGFPNVITFSGMRQGIDEAEGMKNTVNGIKKVIGYAEKKKVTLAFEVLNSRVNATMKGHPDYQGDHIEWGVELCDRVGSERMKLLFDIYHIQIMEGDVISRIRQYKDYIAHYHTAGVPGRYELDDRQEINYPPIIRAIVETGYQGYLGQEFVCRTATSDEGKLASLRAAVKLCDV